MYAKTGRGNTTMLHRYYVTGRCDRFGQWVAESIECRSKQVAKEMFKTTYPTLKKLKAYRVRAQGE